MLNFTRSDLAVITYLERVGFTQEPETCVWTRKFKGLTLHILVIGEQGLTAYRRTDSAGVQQGSGSYVPTTNSDNAIKQINGTLMAMKVLSASKGKAK